MAINCIPCEIILEDSCFSSRNYVDTCLAPGGSRPTPPYPIPFFSEGYVSDDGFDITELDEVKPGPHISTYDPATSAWENSIDVCAWDSGTTLFYYDLSDASSFRSNYRVKIPYTGGNRHFTSAINIVLGDLLSRASIDQEAYNSESSAIFQILKESHPRAGPDAS